MLYEWREQSEPGPEGDEPPEKARECQLRQQISELKRLLGEKAQEVDFFKGALQKIEARRRSSSSSGAKGSTTKSGS